jgi:Tfp pilus assembly protein PilF
VEALAALKTAIGIQPQHPKAILALGSVLQDDLELDAALQKYRVACSLHSNVPQVRCLAHSNEGSHTVVASGHT